MGAQPRWHPVIDYARHPAYGAVLPRPTLRLRLQALVAFARGLALIGGRRLADYEHLPRPRDKAHKLRWMLIRLPMYLRLILRQRWQRLVAGDRYRPDSAAGSAVLKNLQTDGVAALALDPAQQHALRTMLAPHFAELAARLADKPQASRSFDDNRLWLAA